MARNTVVSGNYKNKKVSVSFGTAKIEKLGHDIKINSDTVEKWELIHDEHSKSEDEVRTRTFVGGFWFGTAGAIAAALSSKDHGTYLIAVKFKDGKESLVEVDDEKYKAIIEKCFVSSNVENKREQTTKNNTHSNVQAIQASNDILEYKGKTINLDKEYDRYNGKAVRMSYEICKQIGIVSLEERNNISKIVLEYIKNRK